MVEFSIEQLKQYREYFKVLGDGFQALLGKKPMEQKVKILANPANPKSMSILTRGQAKYVGLGYYLADHKEWGGLFDGIKARAIELMATSPSVNGLGRDQVIAFVGELGGRSLLKRMNILKTPENEMGKER